VTGDWDSDEITVIRDMVTRLATRVGYSRIINHSGVAIEVEGIEVVNTRNSDSAGSQEALERLESEVNRAADDLKLPNPKTGHNRLAQLRALSRFQHGTDVWLEDASVLGRPPIFTIKKEGVQIAQWNPRTARFAFSKSCLPLLDSCNALPRVSLKIGVDWRGDLFSTNVESAEEGIRAGDEVLVMQDGGLVGSARAEAPGWEWPDGPGRLARAQHRL
jgi:predicted RNA-binding protein